MHPLPACGGIVTSLDLNSFLLAFSRFTNLRGAVDTIYSDNGSTFCAAADRLPDLLKSTEFHNSLRKCNINWVRIPPYAPSQGGSWEIMVKLFKGALNKTIGNTRRLPSLIELQTFVADAVRIVNDRPLTTVSDHPNILSLGNLFWWAIVRTSVIKGLTGWAEYIVYTLSSAKGPKLFAVQRWQ